MNISELPRLYIEYSIRKLHNQDLMTTVDGNIPDEMRDKTIVCESRDWVGWKTVLSTVTDQELNELEKHLGLKYPPLYRAFLQSYHFYELGELQFCRHAIHNWRQTLESKYTSYSQLVRIGLIPFGNESLMDAGAVCFDTRLRDDSDDCPVVFWDHEWVGTDKEISPLFSSSEAMFRCLTFMAQSPLDFVYHDEQYDDSATLPAKRQLLSQFLALDPVGAGDAARDYWTSWGVTPSQAPGTAPSTKMKA